MASWQPLITDEQHIAWMASFQDRHGGTPYQVLNGEVLAGDAAYAEAYGAWLVSMDRATPERIRSRERGTSD